VLEAATGTRDEALVLVALMLGLRPGEVMGLRWSAVDLQRGLLAVTASLTRLPGGQLEIGPPKAHSDRTLQLPEAVVTALRTHLRLQKEERLAAPVWEDHDLIFPTEIGTLMDPSNLRRTLKAVATEAGVDAFSPNELRHSTISLLVDAGEELQKVADLVGHRDVRMLASTYRHKIRAVVDVTERQAQMLS
jgi:integrase